QPLAVAPRGATYSYPVVVKSKKGGIKYRLDAAPSGMDVSSTGVITWRVPPDAADVDVILSVSDGSGQEVFQNFKIVLTGTSQPDNKIAAAPRTGPPSTGNAPDAAGAPAPALGDAPVVRMLPSAADDAVVGGGGRYLILRLSQQRKLAVFDASLGRVTRYLSFNDDGFSVAAG